MESKEKGEREDGKESECDDDEKVVVEVAGVDDDDATMQRRKDGGHHHRGQSSDLGDPKDNSSSSQMLGLLDEFTKIYSDRLQRVEQTAMKSTDKQYLESKVCVLESWVRDLGEQNAVLVATVEELEKEAADRVALLEDRLAKMATTTRESCVSLRDHQMQVSNLVADKMGLEREAHGLGDKLVTLERSNLRFKEDNNNLQSDLNNLVQVISRARVTGQWEADDMTFSCVTPEQLFGPVLSSSRRSSQSLKDSQRDYIHHMLEDHMKKDNSSIRSSLSNLQDADSSIYGSRGSDKDVLIMKLKADLRCSQTAHEEVNCQLVERDKQIADLQAHLTEIHHELADSQAEVSRVTHTLQELRHQNRHESVEVTRKEEVIRHLLCKASKKDPMKGSFPSVCDLESAVMGDNNLEAQLSENIDILASRLAELEDECQQLRDEHSALQDTHSLCAPTINMLQDQLSKSQQIDSIDKGLMTEQYSVSPPNGFYTNSHQLSQVSKIQNELAEKSVLLRELQSHLAVSRQEVNLKDETLYKLEQKLNTSRREDGQKGERMLYLTGQLTSLQLEVGRTHGQAEHLRRQVENKNEILQKMEGENSSLTKMLNEKSATLEKYQSDILKISGDLDKKKKEVTDQRLTINTLQDALVTSKRTCDDLRLRLDNDVTSRESETDRLERDLKTAQNLHHQTFTQLVESDARGEVLREENRALSRRVASLQDEMKHSHSLDARQVHNWRTQSEEATYRSSVACYSDSERSTRERDHLRRQLQEAERRCQEMVTSVQLLQGQVHTLEEEVTTSSEARSEAERRASEAQRKNLNLQESLSVHEMESLVKVAGNQEHRSAEQQQELRKIIRDSMQKDRQISTLEAKVEGLKSQIGALEDLVTQEHKEVDSLNQTFSNESKLFQQTRNKLDAARKEATRGEEQVTGLRKDLQHAQDKISRQEQRIKEMESDRDTEVAAVAERLTAAHEASVHRLEDSLLNYSRLQAHDEFQVENLEESLRDFGGRLAESELRAKELDREREVINRSLRQEQMRREEDSQEYQRQLMRITEEMTLLKARLEGVQEESLTWQRQCEDLEERHQHSDGTNSLHTQFHKVQHQVDSLRDALMTAKLETRKAEEERSHAHEQVLSLIRECNTLEEQIHRLTKEKCRLQDQLSCKESDMVLLERDSAAASSKDDLARSADRIAHLERELTVIKTGTCLSELTLGEDEVRSLRQQLTEAQAENQRLKESKRKEFGTESSQGERSLTFQEEVSTLTKFLKDSEHREALLKDQIYVQNIGACGSGGEIMLSQLRSEIAAARRESSEARRMLLERESQGRMAQLKVDTLQKMLQDRQQEVTGLEDRLTETQTETHRSETEVAHLRARVATLTTQLGHAQSHSRISSSSTLSLIQPDKVESLENEMSRLKGEVAAKTEELNQVFERNNRNVSKVRDLEQDIARITKSRDDAHRKVVSLEGTLAGTLESSGATKSLEKMWEAQLANIQQEVSRLLCETAQLKECNVVLHDQLSANQREGEHLRGEVRSKDSQLEELQHARDLLANDAQVVVAAVKQWLHEQKTTNSKLAGKLHQQNKHILHLNTEKQFLAERNTNLQRITHELSLQVHDFRTRMGLPLLSSSPEKAHKSAGMSSGGGILSPRLLSPLGGGGPFSRMVSTTPPLDSVVGPSSDSFFSHSVFSDKFEDGFSTCSSEGSSGGGCHVPGPDLPGSLQLERLAHLADSLLLATRNITKSSNTIQGHKSNKMTSATSLGDLTSSNSFSHHIRSSFGHTKKTSSSVGNLSLLSPIDFRDKPTSPNTKFSYRFSDPMNIFSLGSKVNGKCSDFILPPPVRERKSSHRLFHTHSIEEAEEEDVGGGVTSTSARSDSIPRNQGPPPQEHTQQKQSRPQTLTIDHHLHCLPSTMDSEVTKNPPAPQSSQASMAISRNISLGESTA